MVGVDIIFRDTQGWLLVSCKLKEWFVFSSRSQGRERGGRVCRPSGSSRRSGSAQSGLARQRPHVRLPAPRGREHPQLSVQDRLPAARLQVRAKYRSARLWYSASRVWLFSHQLPIDFYVMLNIYQNSLTFRVTCGVIGRILFDSLRRILHLCNDRELYFGLSLLVAERKYLYLHTKSSVSYLF